MCLKWYPASPTNTARFDGCTARHFRIRFAGNCPQVGIGDVELGLSNKVHYWEPKSGFSRYGEWGAGSHLYTDKKMTSTEASTAKSSPVSKDGMPAIPTGKVVDLSQAIGKDGTFCLGCTGRGLDHSSHRLHEHRHKEPPGQRGRPRAGMRQASSVRRGGSIWRDAWTVD